MNLIPLASSGKATTQLGFGLAFPPKVTKDEAIRLCDAAFAAGIRHFDVAPMYMDGAAEGALGAFIARRPGVTVTTKYGILPTAKRPAHIQLAKKVLGPVLRAMRKVPALQKGLADTAKAMKVSYKAAFTADQLRSSFEHSCRELRVDRVDLFLMHEAEIDDLTDTRLLDAMREFQARGLIGDFGIGGDRSRVLDLHTARRAYCNVMQFNWSPIKPDVQPGNAFRIHFAVAQDAAELQQRFAENDGFCKRLSDFVGADLSDTVKLRAIMMRAAVLRHPEAMVLFSATNPANITRNVAAADDTGLTEPARRLLDYPWLPG